MDIRHYQRCNPGEYPTSPKQFEYEEGIIRQRAVGVERMGELLGIKRNLAYELVNRSDFFPAFRLSGRILISLDALDRWIEQQITSGVSKVG